MKNSNNEISIKRKCSCCGEYLYISKSNINNAIYYGKKTYHSSCFVDLCEKRIANKRKDISDKWKTIYSNMDTLHRDTYSHLINEIDKEEIFKFISYQYDLSVIPSNIWHKLSNIYSGKFKGMTIGIPPSDLFDMWQRKIDMLNNLEKKRVAKGVCMQPEERVTYDLSVLINKYDSYLRWKEKQRILEAEKVNEKSKNIVSKSIGYTKIEIDNKTDSDDISSLVDDIFG